MKFNKFEKINAILEYHTPEEMDKEVLEKFGLEESDLSDINSVNEGLFDKFKNMLSKAMPGGAINKAEKILGDYEKIKKDTLKKIGSLRTTAFKAKIKANANKDDKNLSDLAGEADERMKRASRTVQNAEDKQIAAIEDRLLAFTKDKPERVKTYVQMRVAEIQQKMAELEMKDAEDYASEDELKKLEEIVKKRGALKQKYATKLEVVAKDGKDVKKAGSKLDKDIETAKKDIAKAEGGDKKEDNQQKQAA